jgi:hypothetical protein
MGVLWRLVLHTGAQTEYCISFRTFLFRIQPACLALTAVLLLLASLGFKNPKYRNSVAGSVARVLTQLTGK